MWHAILGLMSHPSKHIAKGKHERLVLPTKEYVGRNSKIRSQKNAGLGVFQWHANQDTATICSVVADRRETLLLEVELIAFKLHV